MQPFSKDLLGEIVADGFSQRVQLAHLALGKFRFVEWQLRLLLFVSHAVTAEPYIDRFVTPITPNSAEFVEPAPGNSPIAWCGIPDSR